ncbi:MAG: hypothetical protein J6T84_03585 [Spirochaetaceae bacterium]|nr:hypothetical protein [Spirochaetaceae bacterium]
MNEKQWQIFASFKNDFKERIEKWTSFLKNEDEFGLLQELQKKAADSDNTPVYPLETPIVYNTAFDNVTREDEIKLIVVGDNPGKNEQLEKNRKYLVGHSGKIAERFFARNSELCVDFRKNVIILNKTPIHTAKTKELAFLQKEEKKLGKNAIFSVMQESQKWMAERTCRLQQELNKAAESNDPCEIWLVGYSELKPNGIFSAYVEQLKQSCSEPDKNPIYVYQHFSMNRFLIDLADFRKLNGNLSLDEALKALGTKHRNEILGF